MQHEQQATTPSPQTTNVQGVDGETTMTISTEQQQQQKKERELRNLESATRQEELTKKTKELFENVSNYLQGELKGCSIKYNLFNILNTVKSNKQIFLLSSNKR
jgi:hypothetical protein